MPILQIVFVKPKMLSFNSTDMKALKYKVGWCLAVVHALLGCALLLDFIFRDNFDAIFLLALADLPIANLVDAMSDGLYRFFNLEKEGKFYLDFAFFIVFGSSFYYVVGVFIQKSSTWVWRVYRAKVKSLHKT